MLLTALISIISDDTLRECCNRENVPNLFCRIILFNSFQLFYRVPFNFSVFLYQAESNQVITPSQRIYRLSVQALEHAYVDE